MELVGLVCIWFSLIVVVLIKWTMQWRGTPDTDILPVHKPVSVQFKTGPERVGLGASWESWNCSAEEEGNNLWKIPSAMTDCKTTSVPPELLDQNFVPMFVLVSHLVYYLHWPKQSNKITTSTSWRARDILIRSFSNNFIFSKKWV